MSSVQRPDMAGMNATLHGKTLVDLKVNLLYFRMIPIDIEISRFASQQQYSTEVHNFSYGVASW